MTFCLSTALAEYFHLYLNKILHILYTKFYIISHRINIVSNVRHCWKYYFFCHFLNRWIRYHKKPKVALTLFKSKNPETPRTSRMTLLRISTYRTGYFTVKGGHLVSLLWISGEMLGIYEAFSSYIMLVTYMNISKNHFCATGVWSLIKYLSWPLTVLWRVLFLFLGGTFHALAISLKCSINSSSLHWNIAQDQCKYTWFFFYSRM